MIFALDRLLRIFSDFMEILVHINTIQRIFPSVPWRFLFVGISHSWKSWHLYSSFHINRGYIHPQNQVWFFALTLLLYENHQLAYLSIRGSLVDTHHPSDHFSMFCKFLIKGQPQILLFTYWPMWNVLLTNHLLILRNTKVIVPIYFYHMCPWAFQFHHS